MGRARSQLARLGSPAAAVAGVLWLLIWWHGAVTHGTTAENEMRTALGLTWMDSSKFLVLPFLLLIPPAVKLSESSGGRRASSLGFVITLTALGLLIAGVALQFWPFPWSSYEVSFESRSGASIAGPLQPISSLVLALGLALLAGGAARRRLIPWWSVPIVVLGALTTFFLTPAGWLPGCAWLVLGLTLSPVLQK